MYRLPYLLVGVAWTLVVADVMLTLHGLKSGQLAEGNHLMRWFVRRPWRLWSISAVVCAVIYFAADTLTIVHGWPYGAAICVAFIVPRVIVVRNNYRLNVKAW